MSEFKIRERVSGSVIILDIEGNLDVHSAPSLKVKLESLIRFGHQKIVINLAEADFIDSSGVGSLVYGLKMINSVTGGLKITGLSNQNYNVFSVLELDRVIPILNTEEDAVGSFHNDGSTMH